MRATDPDWYLDERAYKDRLDDETWADQYLDDEGNLPKEVHVGLPEDEDHIGDYQTGEGDFDDDDYMTREEMDLP